MNHTSKNINRSSLKIESRRVYKIEMPQGLAEGKNRDWLEDFLKTILVKEGAVLDYQIVSAPNNLKNYLNVTVRCSEEESASEIESALPVYIESSPEKSNNNTPCSEKRSFTKGLIGLLKMIFIAILRVMAWLLLKITNVIGYLVDKERSGFLNTIFTILWLALLCNIIRKVWAFFGGDYGNLPGWLNSIIW